MHPLITVFLLSFGALQGALLCILLLREKARRAGHLFLLLYLLTLLGQVLMKIVSKVWLMQNLLKPYWVSYDLPFLYGPLMYLFVRYTLRPERAFQRRDGVHFLPFLVFTAADLYVNTHARDPLSDWLFVSPAATMTLQLISLVGYHIGGYRLLLFFLPRSHGGTEKRPSQEDNSPCLRAPVVHKNNGFETTPNPEKLRFLLRLNTASFIVTSILAIILYIMYTHYPRLSELRYLFAAATVFIYWISYQVLRQPGLFALAPNHATNGAHTAATVNGFHVVKKYHNSTLKESDSATILAQLDRVMQQQRPYLEPELTIDTLATLTGTNRHHLSRVINERLQKNFYDYLNGYRVEEARGQLADPGNDHLKIAAIAYDAGFNSLSTFNEVFKKMTGQTPSEFRRLAQQKSVLKV